MERPPRISENYESLLQKYQLLSGKKIALEKIALHGESSVSVGAVLEGLVQNEVGIGNPIIFDSGATISKVEKFEERNGELLVHTSTSTYLLRPETFSQNENIKFEDIALVETRMGSTYRYLPDGTTQRFKLVEGKEYGPQTALVYVPDYAWLKQHAPPHLLEKLGKYEMIYEQTLLRYIQNPLKDGKKVYIVDSTGKKIETNKEIQEAEGQIYLSFLTDDTVEFSLPVFHTPKIGFKTFDTRRYIDEETGEYMRERHLGNAVVKIVRKEEKETS